MTTMVKTSATLDDLYLVKSKAEIIGGEIIHMPPTGGLPGRAGGDIHASLRIHERTAPDGHALPDNVGFKVDLPNRKSFSPDAAFYVGPRASMKFLDGAPVFAVKVRSENDYPEAEERIRIKRLDYFAAGTKVFWDVDLLGDDVVRVYRADDPENSTVHRRGDFTEAEPAVPGWRFEVDFLFT